VSAEAFNVNEVFSLVDAMHKKMAYEAPPFSLSRLIEALYPDVGVVGTTMKEHASVEIYPQPVNGRRALILYNEDDVAGVQRFSIAHELAHVIFDGAKATVCDRRSVPERRANFFAGELLVPLWVLDQHVHFEIYPDSDDDAAVSRFKQGCQRLASRFNVSLACMKRRVYDLHAFRKISGISRR
jgi:Zn-dependent peptidase ImmA (M78 family)